jgi:hypothetical protein
MCWRSQIQSRRASPEVQAADDSAWLELEEEARAKARAGAESQPVAASQVCPCPSLMVSGAPCGSCMAHVHRQESTTARRVVLASSVRLVDDGRQDCLPPSWVLRASDLHSAEICRKFAGIGATAPAAAAPVMPRTSHLCVPFCHDWPNCFCHGSHDSRPPTCWTTSWEAFCQAPPRWRTTFETSWDLAPKGSLNRMMRLSRTWTSVSRICNAHVVYDRLRCHDLAWNSQRRCSNAVNGFKWRQDGTWRQNAKEKGVDQIGMRALKWLYLE